MNNLEKLATLGIQDTGGRQKKRKEKRYEKRYEKTRTTRTPPNTAVNLCSPEG